MKFTPVFLFLLVLIGCIFSENEMQLQSAPSQPTVDSFTAKTYDEVKQEIDQSRLKFYSRYTQSNEGQRKKLQDEIIDYWVIAIGTDLYSYWIDTPWDFNGTTVIPKKGSIACGYFVTTILQHMGLKIDRIKLAICASSVMMKSLVPNQRLTNLGYLNYDEFSEKLNEYGEGVYIIGLDYHTGFIINDGTDTWFLHSNYIGRKGVVKEKIMTSSALQASKTRWIVSLTANKGFLIRWLKG